MIFQTNPGVTAAVVIILGILVLAGIVYIRSLVVVPFNEIHVISKSKKISTYDGKGRYWFFPYLHGRTIIPKHVLDIEPDLIKLHDIDNLPFGVEISVKVQVTDPQKAAATLTRIDHNTVKKVVEDTVLSASRSVAMERTIIDVMKKREEIEGAIYKQVDSALSKLGLSAIIFDIKNIRDAEGSEVILSLERVKIAELRKNARISEALHNSEAIEVEVEKQKNTKVKIEKMKQEEEKARLEREQETARQQMLVEQENLKIKEQSEKKLAEIARARKMLEAQSDAEAIEVQARASSNAVKMRAEAEAEGIRSKGFAEADILKKKAEALSKGSTAAQIKILEILSEAQVKSAEKIAEALGNNNKIMYLPMDNQQNMLGNFIPKIDAFLQSGMASDLMKTLKGETPSNSGNLTKTSKTTSPK